MKFEEKISNLEKKGYDLLTSGEYNFLINKSIVESRVCIKNLIEGHQSLQQLQGGRGHRNTILESDDHKIFLKQYHHGGLLSADEDVEYSSPQRFLNELQAADRVYKETGLVPRPLGCGWLETGPGWVGFYFSEYIETSVLSLKMREADADEFAREAGNILGRLHQMSLDHLDFHINNLLVDSAGKIYVVDFDPVKFQQPNSWTRAFRCHRFMRSLEKAGFNRNVGRQFLEGYRQYFSDWFTNGFFRLQAPLWKIKNLFSDIIYRMKDRPVREENAEKILVRAPNWVGDAVMSLPFLQDLKFKYPDGIIDVMCRSAVAPVYELCPAVNKVWNLPGKVYDYPEEVKDSNYSAVVVLPKSLRTAIQAWESAIPRRFGLGCRGRSVFLSDPTALAGKHRSQHHARLFYRAAGNLIDTPQELPVPDLPVHRSLQGVVEDLLPAAQIKNYMTIHPGAAFGPAKRWPPQLFRDFLQLVIDGYDLTVVAVGVESERELAAKIFADLPPERVHNLAGQTTLEECIALLAGGRITVANDSGIMHLSGALGTATLGIFASTSPELTAPLGAKTKVVYNKVDCSPCFKRECPLHENKYKCLNGISPAEMFKEWQKLYGES